VIEALAMRIPRVQISIRWLMVAVAGAAVILGLGVAYFRSRHPYLKVRFFNETGVRLSHVQFDFGHVDETSYVSFTSIPDDGSFDILAPGEMRSWDMKWPGEGHFILWVTMPNGDMMASGGWVVSPGSMDLRIQPSGAKTSFSVDPFPRY
jgi:hypothetical protein